MREGELRPAALLWAVPLSFHDGERVRQRAGGKANRHEMMLEDGQTKAIVTIKGGKMEGKKSYRIRLARR